MAQILQKTVATPRYTMLRKYIYYSTILGVFSALASVRTPFTIRLFDGIMILNLIVMFLLVNYIRIPAWIPVFILYISLSGVVGILRHTDGRILVIKECLGISISLLYFYYFFRLIGNDFERAFSTYARAAVWFVIVGIPYWIGLCINYHAFERFRGIAQEPAFFCTLILPAYYWYTYLFFTRRKHGAIVVLFTVAVVLSGSSIGYLSVAFGIVLLLSARMKHFIAIPIAVGGLVGIMYTVSSNFRMRLDDTMIAAATADVSHANLSSYALISNLFVTQQVLQESPIIGNGIGSHPISHSRFIGNITGVENFFAANQAQYNAPDADSFTLRVLSEFGILGFWGVLFFLYFFHVGGAGTRAAISNAILVCFFLKLIRDGLYFEPEQFFFVFIYMMNYRKFKLEGLASAHRATLNSPMASPLES